MKQPVEEGHPCRRGPPNPGWGGPPKRIRKQEATRDDILDRPSIEDRQVAFGLLGLKQAPLKEASRAPDPKLAILTNGGFAAGRGRQADRRITKVCESIRNQEITMFLAKALSLTRALS